MNEIVKYTDELLYRIKYSKDLLDACLAYDKIYYSPLSCQIKKANDYFTITNKATRDMLVLEVAKLFDKHAQSFTLIKLCNRCKSSPEITAEIRRKIWNVLTRFEEYINRPEIEEGIENILFRRDKYYAHSDKKYILNLEAIRGRKVLYDFLKELITQSFTFCAEIYFQLAEEKWEPLLHQNTLERNRNCYDIIEWLKTI